MIFPKSASRHKIKTIIIQKNLLPYECEDCTLSEWKGKSISLHLDHKNGINDDNRLENLRFLCPNCHSLTETYCGKNNKQKFNINNQKVSNETLLVEMIDSKTPAEALMKVGLAGANNYKRIYRLAEEHNINHMKQKIKTEELKNCPTFKCNFIPSEKTQIYCSIICKSRNQEKVSIERILQVYSETKNYTKASAILGISDVAIKKRLTKHFLSEGRN